MKEFLVISRTNGTTRTGSPYALLKVADTIETLNVAVWDLTPESKPEVGQLVSFSLINDNGGKKSCSARDVIPGDFPMAGHPLYTLLPRPVSHEEWEKTISKLLSYCNDQVMIEIIRQFSEQLYTPYSRYPAATSMHHAFAGGLLNHTYQMLHMLEGLYPCLPYAVKVERCILAILFHDYGKVYEYNVQGEPQSDMYLLGHIYIGAHKLHNVLEQHGINKEEIKRTVHCILAHHGTREFGSPVVPCIPEAAIINYLDNISAKTDSREGAGDMEMVPALGTHIVKEKE